MALSSRRYNLPWQDIRKQLVNWQSSILWRKGTGKVCVHPCCVLENPSCDSHCFSQGKGSLEMGQLMENCFADLSIFGEEAIWAAGWMLHHFHVRRVQQRGLWHRGEAAWVCSSQHAGARAPAAGNSLTRIHLQYPLCKHSHGFISLNLPCRRHFPFLFVAGLAIWCRIVMSVNKMFLSCHCTFPVTGCFNNCYKTCSHWRNAVRWSWKKQLYKISKCFRITFMQHLELTLYNEAKPLFVALTSCLIV